MLVTVFRHKKYIVKERDFDDDTVNVGIWIDQRRDIWRDLYFILNDMYKDSDMGINASFKFAKLDNQTT